MIFNSFSYFTSVITLINCVQYPVESTEGKKKTLSRWIINAHVKIVYIHFYQFISIFCSIQQEWKKKWNHGV